MNLNVINRRITQGGIYVGRPSPLGNPFVMGRDGDRNRVIEKYRKWLWQRIQANDPAVLGELERLCELVRSGQRVRLSCWCAPQPCHADVIKSCVEWLLDSK